MTRKETTNVKASVKLQREAQDQSTSGSPDISDAPRLPAPRPLLALLASAEGLSTQRRGATPSKHAVRFVSRLLVV